MPARSPATRLIGVFDQLAAALLIVLMVIVLIDVLGRNLFNRPLTWSTEVLEIVVALMVFLLYPGLGLRAKHITVDLIKVGPRLHRVQLALGGACGALMFGLVAWSLGRQAVRAGNYGEASPLLNIPTVDVLAAMAALAIIAVLSCLIAAVRAMRDRDPGGSHNAQPAVEEKV